jgi:predicted nucleotidyltransferase
MEFQHPLRVVTPTVDGGILAVLARADAVFTTGQVHRVLPDVSQSGIRGSLQRLTAQGIVTAERIGQAYAYRLNREHLAAEHVIGLANLLRAFLGRLETELGQWQPPPAYAAVFGSAARGTMTTGSDIDLLLVRPEGADEDAWAEQAQRLVSRASRWTGNDVRMLVVDEGAVNSDETVLHDVLADGLTVAGSHDWLARRIRRSAKAPA